MAEAFDVALVGKFGMGSTDALQKIWQILLSSRDGNFPLNVQLAAGSTPGPAQTLTSTAAVASGSVTAGASSVTFLPSSDFTGTIDGISYPGTDWQVVPFSAAVGKTLPAIAYTRSAGTLNIIKLV